VKIAVEKAMDKAFEDEKKLSIAKAAPEARPSLAGTKSWVAVEPGERERRELFQAPGLVEHMAAPFGRVVYASAHPGLFVLG
jgi:hypothetical protein